MVCIRNSECRLGPKVPNHACRYFSEGTLTHHYPNRLPLIKRMLYNNSLAFSQKSQPTDHYLTSVMYMIMHLFYATFDITSRTLGTIASAMGPRGALGILGMGVTAYLLLRL